MKLIENIAARPAHGVRLTDAQQRAVVQFVEACGPDRDLDSVVGVLLGVAALINDFRRIPPGSTVQYAERVARDVYGTWRHG